MDAKLKVILSLVIPSSLLIIVAIPLVLNKIPPNCFYGVRLAKTLSNKEAWYKANKFGGICILLAGLVALLGMAVLYLNLDKLSFVALGNLGLLLLVVPMLAAVAVTLAYAARL